MLYLRPPVVLTCILCMMISCGMFVATTTAQEINFTPADTVQLFAPGVISTHLNERDLAVSPDGSEIMYTLGTMDNSQRAIVLIKIKDGKVKSKEIAPFSGRYADIEPFYSPDGSKLYFSSARPLDKNDTSTDYNIWVAEKINGKWNPEPRPVSDVVNSDADEFYPAITSSGNLYFTAAYPTGYGREDIFWSAYIDGRYGAPVPLDTTINTLKYEFNAYVSPGEDIIVFTSYGRPDDMGGGDLYISTKDASGRWGEARHAAPGINSGKLDYCPFIDFNTSTFYFTSNRPATVNRKINLDELTSISNSILNGMGNVYAIRLQELGLK